MPGFTQNGVLELDLDLTALHLPAEGRADFKGFVVQQGSSDSRRGVGSGSRSRPVERQRNDRQVLVAKGGQVVEGKSELNEISPKYFATLQTPFWQAGILTIAIR